jgi:hypothetical protein
MLGWVYMMCLMEEGGVWFRAEGWEIFFAGDLCILYSLCSWQGDCHHRGSSGLHSIFLCVSRGWLDGVQRI